MTSTNLTTGGIESLAEMSGDNARVQLLLQRVRVRRSMQLAADGRLARACLAGQQNSS